MHHLPPPQQDMTLSCVLIMTANTVSAGFFKWVGHITWLEVFQAVGILASVVASCYVAYNQHLSVKWKKDQDKQSKSN